MTKPKKDAGWTVGADGVARKGTVVRETVAILAGRLVYMRTNTFGEWTSTERTTINAPIAAVRAVLAAGKDGGA